MAKEKVLWETEAVPRQASYRLLADGRWQFSGADGCESRIWTDCPTVGALARVRAELARRIMADSVTWQPIETAPKDRVILVNDTSYVGSSSPWVTARWVSDPEWSGWAYEEEMLQDACPLGPCPTHWFDVPPVPRGDE